MSVIFKKIELDDIIIPSMPDVAIKVIAILEDKYCSLKKLEKLIVEDQALTVNILRVANAPFYKTGKSVNTLTEAFMAIGLQNLVALVSVVSLTNQLSGRDLDIGLINHALAVSAAAALLAKQSKLVTEEEALIGGLLHDIGKTIFFANAPLHYRIIKEKVIKEKKSFMEVENELLGYDHCRIGCMLAQQWRLPEIYNYAISNHHDEEIKTYSSSQVIGYNDLLCYVVRIANKVVLDAGVGVGKSTEKDPQALLDVLKIGESVYIDIVKEISAGDLQ